MRLKAQPTVITLMHNGQEIPVTVTDDGFLETFALYHGLYLVANSLQELRRQIQQEYAVREAKAKHIAERQAQDNQGVPGLTIDLRPIQVRGISKRDFNKVLVTLESGRKISLYEYEVLRLLTDAETAQLKAAQAHRDRLKDELRRVAIWKTVEDELKLDDRVFDAAVFEPTAEWEGDWVATVDGEEFRDPILLRVSEAVTRALVARHYPFTVLGLQEEIIPLVTLQHPLTYGRPLFRTQEEARDYLTLKKCHIEAVGALEELFTSFQMDLTQWKV